VQAKNIIIGAKDDSIFREWDASEAADPSPRKVKDDYTIYLFRPFRRKKGWSGFGMPLLSDFGEARIGEPDIYRAPEVILGMSWTAKVDIWNVGVLVCYETQLLPMYPFVTWANAEIQIWDLFEDHHLFDGRGPDGRHSDAQLLAEMIAILGPPPAEFLRKSSLSQNYWDISGQWKASEVIPRISLEDSEEYLEGLNKQMFTQFVRKMLQWDPDERQSARELLTDPWLNNQQ
ncbi:uncharacterized protein N7515_009652, partial [Penicillium bovifimosum]